MPAVVVFSNEYLCDIGAHVFPVEKVTRVLDRLVRESGLAPGDVVTPEPATREELLRVHDPLYLRDLDELRWTPRTLPSELPLTEEIVRAYTMAAGGTLRAAREALRAGAAINVGGGFHHAFANHAEGFCYLNDLAVAVATLRHDGRVTRAAIVDVDVHQGNGTARIFREVPEVFTLSIHQEANYPMPKETSDLDVGLADGAGDDDYLAALDRALESVWAHAPEIVLLQAGADPYRDDQLGGLALTFDGLEARDRRVLEGCAARGIPAVVTLGGGYARRLEDTVEIHVRTCRVALERPGVAAERGA